MNRSLRLAVIIALCVGLTLAWALTTSGTTQNGAPSIRQPSEQAPACILSNDSQGAWTTRVGNGERRFCP